MFESTNGNIQKEYFKPTILLNRALIVYAVPKKLAARLSLNMEQTKKQTKKRCHLPRTINGSKASVFRQLLSNINSSIQAGRAVPTNVFESISTFLFPPIVY